MFANLNNDFLEVFLSRAKKIEKRYVYIFLIVLFLNIMAYGLIIVEFIYTNHTIPNILQQPFPSNRSLEGRWTHDLTYLFQGRSGIIFFQSIIAILIQIFAGILFAIILNRKDNISLFISASIVSLIPYVNDYYGFIGDSIMFTTGDLLAVFGVLILNNNIRNLLAAAFIFQLSIACYQPKIATIAVICTTYCLVLFVDWDGTPENIKKILRSIALLATACLAGAVMYVIALKLLYVIQLIPNSEHFTRRLSINSVDQIPHYVNLAIVDIYYRLFKPETLIPSYIKYIVALVSLISIYLSIAYITKLKAERHYKIAIIIAIIITLFFSIISADLAFIISPNAYANSGRFRTTFGFLIVALIIIAIKAGRNYYNNIALISTLVIVHSYVVTNSSINQQARMKNIAEFSYVNRILSRIESQPGFDYSNKYNIAIFGYFPLQQYGVMSSNTVVSNLSDTSFIDYRQTEMLNWLAGKQVFEAPTHEQLNKAENYASKHNPYPAHDSVFIFEDGLIVVILEKYYPKIPHTWLRD